MHRRSLFLAAILALGTALPAAAATQAKFTPEALAAAQTAGKPILVAFHADWCPVCTKQKPIVNGLMQQPDFADLVILNVDYDNQKDVVKAFGVTMQSTMVAMHGKVETGRATGITAEDAIKALMLKTKA